MLHPAPELPSWLAPQLPFRRRMAEVLGHRIHLIDQGSGPAVLLVHGNPTWCYLWRRIVPLLDGHRVIAPDLLGFGLSDKPRRTTAHTLDAHVRVITALVDALDMDFVAVGQDWGGPIAAGVAQRLPGRVRGLVFGNTGVLPPRRPLQTKGFHRLSHAPVVSDALFRGLGFPLSVLHRAQGDPRSIGRVERRAYRWPLRRLRDRAGPLALARMVPNAHDHPSTAVMDEIGAFVTGWRGPAALVWGTRDPILGRGLRRHREALPQAAVFETEAGHFLQEEVPEVWAEAIAGVATP